MSNFKRYEKLPRLSIGLPVYNGENYLKQALDSLLTQTFESFEIIISDNASTDGTEEICRHYVAVDKRVHYYRNEENLGAAINYNRTFELATGEYFKWAAHDDLCAPEFLERCISVLDHEPTVVLCYPKTTIINGMGEKIVDYEDRLDLRSPIPHERFRGFLRKPPGCNPIAGLMRKSVLNTTQLIGSYESSDLNLLAAMCLRGPFFEVPERLFYRRNHFQMSRRARDTSRDFARWFNTKYRGKNSFPVLIVFLELIKCINYAPISRSEKINCLAEVARSSFLLCAKALDWRRARVDCQRMY